MTALSPETFGRVVRSANLAPSVHNTQPTRWRLEPDGAISLHLDGARRLAVGDPEGRDARLSCGTALEGTRLALAELGLGFRGVECSARNDGTGVSPVVRIEVGGVAGAEPQAGAAHRRFTWRGGFAPSTAGQRSALADIAASRDDATLVSEPEGLSRLADINDEASLFCFRDRAYRGELLHWMRLSRSHPAWASDGMNAAALGMTRIEAFAAGIVLRSPVFDAMNALGLSRSLVSESAKTRSSTAILLFHRPIGEDPLDSGVALYRLWLSLAACDLAAWPMAVVADNPERREEVSRRFGLSPARRLLNLLRVGPMPPGARPRRARLAETELIV